MASTRSRVGSNDRQFVGPIVLEEQLLQVVLGSRADQPAIGTSMPGMNAVQPPVSAWTTSCITAGR